MSGHDEKHLDEKYLKDLPIETLLNQLPTYAQVVSHEWPQGTSENVIQAWVFGIYQAANQVKDIIERWKCINLHTTNCWCVVNPLGIYLDNTIAISEQLSINKYEQFGHSWNEAKEKGYSCLKTYTSKGV